MFELVLMSVDASVVETLQALLDNSIQLSGDVQSMNSEDAAKSATVKPLVASKA